MNHPYFDIYLFFRNVSVKMMDLDLIMKLSQTKLYALMKQGPCGLIQGISFKNILLSDCSVKNHLVLLFQG